jgi:hypothetical protein
LAGQPVNSVCDPSRDCQSQASSDLSVLAQTVAANKKIAQQGLYAFLVLFFCLGWEGTHSGFAPIGELFSYFTDLTYWGLAFYFVVSATHTFIYARSGRQILQSWPRPLQALHVLFYTTITTFPFLVTIVYWGILYDGFDSKFERWSNVRKHLCLEMILGLTV